MPRRGSRVRIPSRALKEIEKRVIRWMALFSMFKPCRARTVRMSPRCYGRRSRTSPGRSATSRALKEIERGCRISKYFLLGGSPALCPNGIEIGHVFDAILYKRSSFPGIPFGMPYFRLFCFQLSKSMPFLMEKDNFPFFRSESCNEAY